MRGTVFALAGGKGGVGKTTVTVNAAVGLVKNDYDVAVVDGDLGMTNLDLLLDVDADIGVHSVLGTDTSIEDAAHTQGEGLTIVPGERGIETNGDVDPAKFHRVIDPLAEAHDIVLIDTGAGITHLNCVAYGRSDAVVLVTTPTQMSVINAKETRDLIERVSGTLAGLVVTRDQPSSDRPRPAEIAAAFETDLLAAIPEYDTFAPDEPRLIHKPQSDAAERYRQLATALSVYHETGSAAEIHRQLEEKHTSTVDATRSQTVEPVAETDASSDSETETSSRRRSLVSRLVSNETPR